MALRNWSWETVDFKVAQPGWRIMVVDDPDRAPDVSDLPGWLVQDYLPRDVDDVLQTLRDVGGENARPDRRVIAGVIEDGEVDPADGGEKIFVVLGPSAPDLTEEEIADLQRQRRSILESRRAAVERERRARG